MKTILTIELSQKETQQTSTSHKILNGEYWICSVTYTVYTNTGKEASGGALFDTNSDWDYFKSYPKKDIKLLETWHLNDLHPGCEHQKEGPYDDQEIANQVCPHSGYKYGHAWLFREIPEDTLEELKKLQEKYSGKEYIWSKK